MDLLYNLLWKANRFQNLEYFEVWVPLNFRGTQTSKYSRFWKRLALNHPFYFRIFHEINHPAGLGIPHEYGNLHFPKGNPILSIPQP